MGIGLKIVGVIPTPEQYAVAASTAVLSTFLTRDARTLSQLTETLYGAVSRESAEQVKVALASLDNQMFIAPELENTVRLFVNYGTQHDYAGRVWATGAILEHGVKPHVLVPQRAAVPVAVDCVVGCVPDARYPYVIADVPKDYAPTLGTTAPGSKCAVPRIPKSFIIGMNGLPLSSFEASWYEYHGK
jgi:hypothetical protein